MDKTRRILLTVLGLLLAVSVSVMMLSVKNDQVRGYRRRAESYRTKTTELADRDTRELPALEREYRELKATRDKRESRRRNGYADVYDFGRQMLTDFKTFGLEASQYRLYKEEGITLLEAQIEGSPRDCFAWIRHVTEERPECMIPYLSFVKKKDKLRIMLRIGYETDI